MEKNSTKESESIREGRLLKAKDVASILNISLGFAYQLMKHGDVTTVRLGRAVRVRRSDLEEFIDNKIKINEMPHKHNYNDNK